MLKTNEIIVTAEMEQAMIPVLISSANTRGISAAVVVAAPAKRGAVSAGKAVAAEFILLHLRNLSEQRITESMAVPIPAAIPANISL